MDNSLKDAKRGNKKTPLTPQNGQKRIVAKVDQLMALCDALESGLTQSQSDCERLVGAVVAEVMAA